MEGHAVPQSTITAPEKFSDLTRLLHGAEGFASVLSALEKGQSVTVDGAWGSSAGLAAATLARSAPQTTLIVIAHPRDLDAWAGDLASFGGIRPAVLPAWDNHPGSGVIDEVAGQRLRLLKQMEGDEQPRVVLTTFQALIQPVPDRAQLAHNRRILEPGQTIDLDEWAGWLVEHGYQATEAVELPGEFSRRGGILDIYPPDADAPYRLELFGDEIDSVRQFSAQTQRSLGVVESAEVSAVSTLGKTSESSPVALSGHFCDYLPAGSWTILVETEELAEQGKHYLERIIDATGLYTVEGVFARLVRFPSVKIASLPSPTVETACHLRVESVEQLSGDINRIRDELDSVAARDHVLIACPSEAEVKRLREVLAAGDLARSDRLRLVTGRVRAGFRLLFEDDKVTRWQGDKVNEEGQIPVTLSPGHLVTLSSSVVVLGGQELFQRDEARQVLPRRRLESRAIDSFLDLSEGDLVVHVSHGIARFRGMQMVEKNATPGSAPVPVGEGRGRRGRHTEEHLVLEFRDGVRVYVPASRIDLVQKYVGGGRSEPELSKFGGTAWQKRKDRVQQAVMDLASDMIGLQAVREAQPGLAYPADSEWQAEFEGAFPYQETPDQLTTLGEIKADMERPRPMDRLICGDVGYGKTELAVRAAFKAIDNGRQVAVLVPTTVLAEQHYRTFSQRFAEFPFVVECLSRFRSGKEQRLILERLAKGGVDVVIGTHRLVSADVRFKDLGLVVIDEEQRFGVEHKERLKHLRQQVDVLTLTATPIPRTLHLSLLGIRDISNLETPPPDRLAIETRIVRFDPQLIRNAILREMNREGQIYFVHNRVQDIDRMASRLEQIVPEARIAIVHGQMSEADLEERMLQFIRREADILLATTIIESGLDIPNANTMFINEADHYGLADLHQLRGRVGRYKHRAYAYLLLDGARQVSPNAAKRLKAIEEFTSLGAGFRIAMRDLEIRGAGNILGTQQSGHIAAVGYELYCQLLEEAVRALKQMPLRTPLEVTIDLPWVAYLPRDYVAGQKGRIEVYRRLTRVRKLDRLEDFRQELRDRFGPIPEPAEWLLRLQELRLLATAWRVASLHLEGPAEGLSGPTEAVLSYRNAKKMKELAQRGAPHLRIVDDTSAYFRLGSHELEPEPLYRALRELLRT
jgi:transcription-repair coupling factor (superfamily II helicase)